MDSESERNNDIPYINLSNNLQNIENYNKQLLCITKNCGITKSKLMLRDIEDLKSFSFIDKNAQKQIVTALEIYQCPNVIFEPLPMHLTSLLIKSSQLSKLNGLEKMTQLTSLDFGSNKLSKVDELQYLTNLKKLVLSNNQINKINWIKKLARLEYLSLSNNRILFINDLNEIDTQNFKGITDLFIEDNVIQDIQKLKNYKNFKLSWFQKQSKITLQDCKNYLEGTCSDTEAEKMFEQLKIDKQQGIKDKKQYNLKMIQKYQNQKIGQNQLEIANDEEITYFDFADDLGLLKLQIEKSNPDIQFDVVPKKLLMLWIHHNKTSRIQGVEQMTKLGALSFWDNQISDISPLSSLIHLKSLFLNDNEIEDLRPLENLTEIIELNIGINVITNIAPLRKLVKLTSLFMSFNQVKDLSPLENCTKLQKLCAAQNKIESVYPLKSLTGMIQLILTENCIEDFSALYSHPNRSVYQLDKQTKK
ncbi:leucine-rich_repeat domain-containing protein [Hexamita inflata]|uniref:Leucine-rich_repeat domain-containing protein n=1 Tax=Hexamita inflata TaxID=28002 RepID=A0ABP1KAU0_9EUKA